FSQFPEDWDTLYFNLDDLERGMLQIRFEVTSDHAIGEDGWLIDKVTVYKAEYENKVAVQTVIPMEFSLTTYPNPFNSTTTITYSLPVASLVSLQLYDIAGRNIRTLFEGNRQAGVHTVNLDAGEMPSGIYLIKLEGSGQVMLRKVTFLK
ncbi:MAG: T9SS type A sorting domain-containing protein, partial [Calditrichaeota bacterium]|nr:T9SS type A sorting domain-containing protein [Calditrichota bacterium]